MHGACAGERDPDGVEDVAVGEDPHVEVGLEDVVEPTDLLVAEEGVRHPNLGGVSHRQVADLVCEEKKEYCNPPVSSIRRASQYREANPGTLYIHLM